jgi:prepilin-type N-terminal cleavage/methylation domain-containing protein
MTRRRAIVSPEGFTLIEIMIALVILSIALLALAGLQIATIQGNARARRMTTAASLAELTLEDIKRTTAYNDIQSGPATQLQASGLTFTRQVTVTDNSPVAHSKTVTVTVSWSNGATISTLPLTTTIARYP